MTGGLCRLLCRLLSKLLNKLSDKHLCVRLCWFLCRLLHERLCTINYLPFTHNMSYTFTNCLWRAWTSVLIAQLVRAYGHYFQGMRFTPVWVHCRFDIDCLYLSVSIGVVVHIIYVTAPWNDKHGELQDLRTAHTGMTYTNIKTYIHLRAYRSW